jgi:hypothetical protein
MVYFRISQDKLTIYLTPYFSLLIHCIFDAGCGDIERACCLVEFCYWTGMFTMVMEVSTCLSQIPEFCTCQYIVMTMAASSQVRRMPTTVWWELGKGRDITLIFPGIRYAEHII